MACRAVLCPDCIELRHDETQSPREQAICRYCCTPLHQGVRCLDEEEAPPARAPHDTIPSAPVTLAEAVRARLHAGVAAESAFGLCQACGHLTHVDAVADLRRTACRRCGAICWLAEGGEQVLGSGVAGPPDEQAWLAAQESLFEDLRRQGEIADELLRALSIESWYWTNRYASSYFRIPALLIERGQHELAERLEAAMRRARGRD